MFEALGAEARIATEESQLAEMVALAIDSRLARQVIGWLPVLNMQDTLAWTDLWYREFRSGTDSKSVSLRQIDRYLEISRSG